MAKVISRYRSLAPGLAAILQRMAPALDDLPSTSSPTTAQRHHATTSQPKPGASKEAMPRVLQHRTKQAMIESVSVPLSDPHGPMHAIERHSGGEYDDGPLIKQLASKGRLDGRRAELVRLLRRHNYSLPNLIGQTIQAQVLRVGAESVFVDPGFYGISEVPRSEIKLSHLCMGADGELPEGRAGVDDVRIGDMISVRVDALYTPYGDMQIEAIPVDGRLRLNSIWQELVEARRLGKSVPGRVLNACTGGYAVGIAGIVALMPYGRFTLETASRIGVLEKFHVETVNEERGLLLVADVRKGSSRTLV